MDSVQQEVIHSWLSVPRGSRNQFLEDIKGTRVALGAAMAGKELQAANPKKSTFGGDPNVVLCFSFFLFFLPILLFSLVAKELYSKICGSSQKSQKLT